MPNRHTVMAAQWFMKSLAPKHPLIRYYMEVALLRDEVKDPFAATLAARAVGMEVKVKK